MLSKLKHYGIRGVAYNWVKSYLSNRQQYVYYNDTSSDNRTVTCGVPQGSNLGPLLFIIYINDLCNVSNILKLVLFADDTNLFTSGHDLEHLTSIVTSELRKLQIWFNLNKLSLNVTKTNYMLFTTNKRLDNVNIKIDDICIEEVRVTKFLGVLVDNKLDWKDHIYHVRLKLAKCISILYKATASLDQLSLFTLYNSLFLPYMSYCIEIWATASKSNLNCISIMQKKAIRIITKSGKLDHTHSLFTKLRILKFTDLIKLRICIVMHKVKLRLLPNKILDRYSLYCNVGQYSLRRQDKFRTMYARTTLKQKCLSHLGVRLYNDIPKSITSSQSINIFKLSLKKYIINQYLDNIP